jgi:tRNA(adenine34) deaminase
MNFAYQKCRLACYKRLFCYNNNMREVIPGQFSERDARFMNIALGEAEEALNTGNYPVGAVLVINGEMIDKEQNRKDTRRDYISHAETLLYIRNSQELKSAKNERRETIELYTTLAPCLMCLGVAVLHRTSRIVVGCPDPRGDISTINPDDMGHWYKKNWPTIEYGLSFNQAFNLYLRFLEQKTDQDFQIAKQDLLLLRERFGRTE